MMKPNLDSRSIEEVAAGWFVRRQSGEWTAADEMQFDVWIEAHTAHRLAYLRLDAAWARTARLKALNANISPGVVPPRDTWDHSRGFREASREPADEIRPARRSRPPRRKWHYLASAATAVALAVSFSLYHLGYLTGERYSTPVGGLQSVALRDGTHIILNTDTKLRAAVAGDNERRIELERGEAFFQVAHDRSRPFVVHAGDQRIMAVGTQFSVRRSGDDVQIVVTEGLVKLANAADFTPAFPKPEQLTAPALSTSASGPERFLAAGTMVRSARNRLEVRQETTTRAESALSWRSGYVSFQNVSLSDAVAEFNRYNARKMYIEDPSIASVHLSGKFRSTNTDAFLFLIQNGYPISVEASDDRIVLRRR